MDTDENSLKVFIRRLTPNFVWKSLKEVYYFLLYRKYEYLGRPKFEGETHKARKRRTDENFFSLFCNGQGLDIGYGGDLVANNCRGFDMENGNAQYLRGIKDSAFDFVYSSHTLEHLLNAETALRNWWRVLKPGGFLILYLPHRDLYEKQRYLPSKFSESHYRYFLIDEEDLPDTIGIIPFLNRIITSYEIIYSKVCDADYVSNGPDAKSQGEYSIEIVIKKLSGNPEQDI